MKKILLLIVFILVSNLQAQQRPKLVVGVVVVGVVVVGVVVVGVDVVAIPCIFVKSSKLHCSTVELKFVPVSNVVLLLSSNVEMFINGRLDGFILVYLFTNS
jgi:hypothetical protein